MVKTRTVTVDGQPGPWPKDVSLDTHGEVTEGLVVRSISGEIEGRTTGARRPCISHGCPGWFITVSWETGQLLHICSEGWRYDPATNEIGVVAGGELSARYVSPRPLGTPPRPREEWPDPATLAGKGWRVSPR